MLSLCLKDNIARMQDWEESSGSAYSTKMKSGGVLEIKIPVYDFGLTLMGHNTIRGAAGASILNAELLKAQGFLE